METKTPKNDERITVPYIVHEASEARHERHVKRLIISIIVCVSMLFASNLAWLFAWMQYDYTGEVQTEQTTYGQFGEGTNIIGDSNEVN